MAAAYPGAYHPFTTKVDLTSIVYAGDMNDVQNEVLAIESTLGVNPHGSYSSVRARLDHIDVAKSRQAWAISHPFFNGNLGAVVNHSLGAAPTVLFGNALGIPVTLMFAAGANASNFTVYAFDSAGIYHTGTIYFSYFIASGSNLA